MTPLRIIIIRRFRPLVPKDYVYGAYEDIRINTGGPRTLKAIDTISDYLPNKILAISSPSPRAQATAQAVLQKKFGTASNPITLDQRFVEQNFGDITGMTREQVARGDFKLPPRENIDLLNSTPFPGEEGESMNNLLERVSNGLKELALKFDEESLNANTVAIFAHGGVMKAAHAFVRNCYTSQITTPRRLSLSELNYQKGHWQEVHEGLTISP